MFDDLVASGILTPAARITLAIIVALTLSGLAAVLFSVWRAWDQRRHSGQSIAQRRRSKR